MRSPANFIGILLMAIVLAVALVYVMRRSPAPDATVPVASATNSAMGISSELAAALVGIESREQKIAETAWVPEILAQECGRTFEVLWDSINHSTNKLAALAGFETGEIILGKWDAAQSFPHQIQMRQSTGTGAILKRQQWRSFIDEFERAGWRLAQIEFRHNRFDTNSAGQPHQSTFYFSAHLTNSLAEERAMIEGDLLVEWGEKEATGNLVTVQKIDARQLIVKSRKDEPPFKPILVETIALPEYSRVIDPLIIYDLDGDGFSEIILAAKNLIYRRTSDGNYKAGELCRKPERHISTAVIADFDGDGAADFLCHKYEGLFLFKGSSAGRFDNPARRVWSSKEPVIYAMALTCGDIDHDDDLDVFLGQYKEPYEDGRTPTPYYDARDGNPAYLLLNDGKGNFTDNTVAAGLTTKRSRRTYSASFAHLNEDLHLDLLVVSDFAGIDLYENDGQGRFSDVTSEWVKNPYSFGMAHALADFNVDGRSDLLMIGMTSPTVERLEHLNLWRPDSPEDRRMRTNMTFGNRLYIAQSNGGFEQTALSDSIARSGWSWGCSAFDFDNDGYPDVYIANGLESNESVRDYEAEYWLHDKYVGSSTNEAVSSLYFKSKFSRTRGRDYSYGGYEKNRFYLNLNGYSFLEVGHLFGLALEQDCRNVVADDLDGDGRVDLLVTTLEIWPQSRQRLHLFKNVAPAAGHWIGFRSPAGVRVLLRSASQSAVQQIVTGDSYRSQHANTLHFGLGQMDRLESVEAQWPNGHQVTLRNPALNRYYVLP